MDLRSHYPYSLLRHGIVNSYASLEEDTHADIAVMGAGISGSLVAYQLSEAGFNVIIVDKRHAGMGSTVASTSLLQYELDIPLHELIKLAGEKKAVASYLLCRDAINRLDEICRIVNARHLFRFKPSLQFTSYKYHQENLETEYRTRKKYGIRLALLNTAEIKNIYGFNSTAGLLSENGAEADAYRLTHALLEAGIRNGLRVYDNTWVKKIRYDKKGVTLITNEGKKIKAGKLVIACGYESQKFIPGKIQNLHSTFVVCSEPLEQKEFWYKNSLIWETANPYLYLRTTFDNRIMIGGKDIPTSDPEKRDQLLKSKSRSLELSFLKKFPGIPFKTDFAWAGSYASTKDALPYIGSIRQRPSTYFALGLGGNGTTFSVIAADIIRDFFSGKKNPAAELFSFDR